jgi:para-aminobenzoate synthetase/4-amino-4-deoxychorismate lyase
MEVRCRFDNFSTGRAFELVGPQTVVATSSIDEVTTVLAEVDRLVASGKELAGFVAYEAAPAFDPAYVVRPATSPSALPLVWFAAFDSRDEVGLVASPSAGWRPSWRWTSGFDEYRERFLAVQSEIAEGWTYQVNLTTKLLSAFEGDPVDLYSMLVHAQHGAHHGLLVTDEFAVACGSPELFFSIDGGRVTTRPMKGTARRGPTPAEDQTAAAALVGSEKERAENVMIVDLLRNDLGRLAPFGGVETTALFALEQYPTVWQLTSSIEATLGRVELSEVFAALFPAGSVTGAPKASSMAIIARLESDQRGPYCGAFGWAHAPGGALEASFAVPIRTAVVDRRGRRAAYGVGSGITVDSTAEGEWAELAAKVEVLTDPPSHGTLPFGPERGGARLHPSGPDDRASAIGLLETLRFDPETGYVNLDRHLARLEGSARRLGYDVDRPALDAALRRLRPGAASRVRIVVGHHGEVTVTAAPLAPLDDQPVRLRFATVPVDRRDPRLYDKTTDRERYDAFLPPAGEGIDDVVLWNREGEVTETTRANVLVGIAGAWWTPPVSCGLLPGVGRAIVVEGGTVAERVITREELRTADRLEVVSSLRGRRRAVLVDEEVSPGLLAPAAPAVTGTAR